MYQFYSFKLKFFLHEVNWSSLVLYHTGEGGLSGCAAGYGHHGDILCIVQETHTLLIHATRSETSLGGLEDGADGRGRRFPSGRGGQSPSVGAAAVSPHQRPIDGIHEPVQCVVGAGLGGGAEGALGKGGSGDGGRPRGVAGGARRRGRHHVPLEEGEEDRGGGACQGNLVW